MRTNAMEKKKKKRLGILATTIVDEPRALHSSSY